MTNSSEDIEEKIQGGFSMIVLNITWKVQQNILLKTAYTPYKV